MGTKTSRVLEALRDVYPRTQRICDGGEGAGVANGLVNTENALPNLAGKCISRRQWLVTSY